MTGHIANESLVDEIKPQKTVWGPWATAGFGFIVLAVFFLVQFAVGLVYVAMKILTTPGIDIQKFTEEAKCDGTLLSIASLFSSIVSLVFIALFAKIRKTRSTLDYLGIRAVRLKTLTGCACIAIGIVAVSDAVTYFLGRPIVHEFMSTMYSTVMFKPLLWLAICFAAPVFEEVFFRGFLFTGFQKSRLGNAGAILLTTLPWTMMHVQYGVYELSQIFVLGVVLGYTRVRSESTVPAIIMHITINLVATTETAIVTAGG
jgi:membrane protease YdiL (CAAX protease family)